jgi:hypothetical protein
MRTPIVDTRAYNLGLQDALQPGETILWVGAPPRRVLLRRRDLLAIPFAAIWLVFAAWIANLVAADAGVLAAVFVSLISLAVLTLVPARLLLDAARRCNTGYALTDCRVLIVSTFPFRNVISLPLRRVNPRMLSLDKAGNPTIDLKPSRGFTPKGYIPLFILGFSATPPLRLEAVSDGGRVYQAIMAAKASAEREETNCRDA